MTSILGSGRDLLSIVARYGNQSSRVNLWFNGAANGATGRITAMDDSGFIEFTGSDGRMFAVNLAHVAYIEDLGPDE